MSSCFQWGTADYTLHVFLNGVLIVTDFAVLYWVWLFDIFINSVSHNRSFCILYLIFLPLLLWTLSCPKIPQIVKLSVFDSQSEILMCYWLLFVSFQYINPQAWSSLFRWICKARPTYSYLKIELCLNLKRYLKYLKNTC